VATRAFEKSEVLPAAMDLARDIAVNAAPLPVAIAKHLIWEGVGIDLDEWRKREGKLFAQTIRHPDAREGTIAFLEKRAPEWKGSPTKEYPEELTRSDR
jgi:enoyl-CoA hydratase/carnithine racemase